MRETIKAAFIVLLGALTIATAVVVTTSTVNATTPYHEVNCNELRVWHDQPKWASAWEIKWNDGTYTQVILGVGEDEVLTIPDGVTGGQGGMLFFRGNPVVYYTGSGQPDSPDENLAKRKYFQFEVEPCQSSTTTETPTTTTVTTVVPPTTTPYTTSTVPTTTTTIPSPTSVPTPTTGLTRNLPTTTTIPSGTYVIGHDESGPVVVAVEESG
jgi:hypothetical protein